jgi:hypothetical protein
MQIDSSEENNPILMVSHWVIVDATVKEMFKVQIYKMAKDSINLLVKCTQQYLRNFFLVYLVYIKYSK